jgi:hypothetical protein
MQKTIPDRGRMVSYLPPKLIVLPYLGMANWWKWCNIIGSSWYGCHDTWGLMEMKQFKISQANLLTSTYKT